MRLLRGSSLVVVWFLLLLCRCHPVGTHASKRSRTQSKHAAFSGLSETEAAGCGRVQFLLGATSCETFLAEVSLATGTRRSMLALLLILAGVRHYLQYWETKPLLVRETSATVEPLFRSKDLPHLLRYWQMKVNAEHGCATRVGERPHARSRSFTAVVFAGR